MKTKKQTYMLVCGVAAVLIVACGIVWVLRKPQVFSELRIESHPASGGFASKTVKADGTITGGHLSGGIGPGPTNPDDKVSIQDMSKLRSLITSLPLDAARGQTSSQDTSGYKLVVITFPDGSATTFSSKSGQHFESKEAQDIWDIVAKHKVGGW